MNTACKYLIVDVFFGKSCEQKTEAVAERENRVGREVA